VGAYESPPKGEMSEWGLVEQYGYDDPGHSRFVNDKNPDDSRSWSIGKLGV
jgi:hypothetical protein